MSIRVRTPEEIRRALDTQIKAVESSCAAFDRGERWESIRIATAIHTVVHDASRKNKSLLTHLGAKQGLRFLSSGHPINPANLMPSHPLVMIAISNAGGRYQAKLADGPFPAKPLAFSKWWEEPIFSSGRNQNLLTRKNLVFGLRNKDGGGHYDNQIHDSSYVTMAEGSLWMSTSASGEGAPLRDLELTSMRQIGWELIETLKLGGLYNKDQP